MAGDRARFEKAYEKWLSLHKDSSYSVSADVGRVAILCPYYNLYEKEAPKNQVNIDHKDRKIFRKEAFTLAEILKRQGRNPEVILNATVDDFDYIFGDPFVSDVIVIGNGTLSKIYMNEPISGYDWKDASSASDHLKTGQFIQRQCGGLGDRLPVPLGTFVVNDFRSVIAAPGVHFTPRGLHHPQNYLLKPVFGTEDPTYEYIRNMSSQTQVIQ